MAPRRSARRSCGRPRRQPRSGRRQRAPASCTRPPRNGLKTLPPGTGLPTTLPSKRVSVPIRRTEPVPLDAAKATPTEVAAASNTAPRGQPAQTDWRTLTFSSGVFLPQPGLDERMVSSLPALRDAGRRFVYGFVSLNVFLTETIRDELAQLDVTLLGPHDTMHRARLPANAAVLADVLELPRVEWIGFSTVEQKTSRELDVATRETDETRTGSTDLDLVVNLFDDDPAATFRRALEQTGAVVGDWDADLRAYFVTASPAELEALIRLDFVLFVEPVRRTTAHHDESMAVIGADYIRDAGYEGSGISVGVIDSGFSVQQHIDLRRPFCDRDFTGSSGGATLDGHGHGTHVLGTIVGTGAANPRYKGVAPGVDTLVLAKVFSRDPDTGKATGAALLRRRLFRLFIGVFARGRSLSVRFARGQRPGQRPPASFGRPARPESRCPDAAVVPSAPLDIRAAFWYDALGREMPLRWP